MHDALQIGAKTQYRDIGIGNEAIDRLYRLTELFVARALCHVLCHLIDR